jgi:hypothetical protein
MPDEATVGQARRVLKVARERGADPILALHDAGLLWFPARERELYVTAVTDMAQVIDEASVDALSGRGTRVSSAGDMKGVVVAWLRHVAAARQDAS